MRLVLAGSFMTGLGMLVVGQTHEPTTIVVGIALLGSGLGLTLPLLTTLASQAAPAENRGFVLGIAQSCGGLARTVGPLLGGLLFARLSPSAPFVGGALAAAICIGLGLTLEARRPAVSA
jgi:DHA1 family tetracycline resistance protein-like MFS transporter